MDKVKKITWLRRGIILYIFCFNIAFLVLQNGKMYSQIINDVRSGNSGSSDLLLKNSVSNNLKDLPLTFRKNMGQWDGLTKEGESKILYNASSPGWEANVYFMKDKLSFGFLREGNISEAMEYETTPGSEEYEVLVWNLHFIGANPGVQINEYGSEKSTVNYFLGSDPSKYAFGVPECRTIEYKGLYTGVDLRYYTSGKEIKYDYIVNSGADISHIKMCCEGIKKLRINGHHQLEIINPWGTLIEEIPESYQVKDGERREVKIAYVLKNDTTFGFEVIGSYERSMPLIIDPVILKWGTYAGGNNTGYLFDITSDAAGNVYGTGWYFNTYPTTAGSYDPSYNGGTKQPGGDVFVFKMKPDATGPFLFATYIGGSGEDSGWGIALDNTGNIYVTGKTTSTNFPTTAGCFDNSYNGASFFTHGDAFVTKLNPSGSALIYSTFMGGAYDDWGKGIIINATGEAFVTGVAGTNDFPTTAGVFDNTTWGMNAFVTRLNAAGSGLIYSTFIGGSNNDWGNRIVLGAGDIAYVTGMASSGFPTTAGAFDKTFNDAAGNGMDAFFSTVSANGSSLLYSTYLGGTTIDQGVDIAIGSAGDAYITGYTRSTNFPTTVGAYSTVYNGNETAWGSFGDVFVSHINPIGFGAADMIYSTFIGGGGDDVGGGIVVNSKGEAYIAGFTVRNNNPNNYPTTTCAFSNSPTIQYDHFVSKLSANGSSLMYSTYIGGNWLDYSDLFMGIVLKEGCGDEIIVGATTHSNDYPTTAGVMQPAKFNFNVGWDQPIVFKFSSKIVPGFVSSTPICKTPVSFTDTTSQCGLFAPLKTWLWDFGDGSTSTLQNPSHIYNASGTYQVKLVLSCPKDSVTKSITVTGTCAGCVNPPILTTSSTPVNTCTNVPGSANVTINPGTGTAPYTYSWSNGGATSSISNLTSQIYTVTVADAGTCIATTTVNVTTSPPLIGQFTKGTASCTSCGCKQWVMINATGGTSPYSYSWPDGYTNRYKNQLCPGNYSVNIKDKNGCSINVSLTAP